MTEEPLRLSSSARLSPLPYYGPLLAPHALYHDLAGLLYFPVLVLNPLGTHHGLTYRRAIVGLPYQMNREILV